LRKGKWVKKKGRKTALKKSLNNLTSSRKTGENRTERLNRREGWNGRAATRQNPEKERRE